MQTDSLAYKTLKNVSYSFLGYAWPIVFSVFVTPIVVRKLGVADYGILVLVNTVYIFLTLIDLGLSTALQKYVSEYHAQNNIVRLTRIINSAHSLFLIVAAVGLLIFVLIGFCFPSVFHIAPEREATVSVVFLLAGLLFFVNTLVQSYASIPSSLQRYDITTRLSMGHLTLYNLAMLTAVLLGHGLVVIFGINLFLTVCLAFFWVYYAHRLLPHVRYGFAWAQDEIMKAYRFGILAALAQLSNSALAQLDRLLIPMFIGPAGLTYYSLPGSVAQKSAGITGSMGSIFFPLTSALQSTGQTEKINIIYRRGFRNITLVAAAVCSAIAFFGHTILLFWLGADFAQQGTTVLYILTATYFVLSVYIPLTNFLLGLGKVRLLTLVSVVVAALNLVFLVFLLPRYGIVGAAWAFFAALIPIPVFFYWTEHKILHLSGMLRFYVQLYAGLLVTTGVFYIICTYVLIPLVTSLSWLLIVGPCAVLLYFAVYKLLGLFPSEDWDLVVRYARQILVRIKGRSA